MITLQAILDTIEYISSKYVDKCYYVNKNIQDFLSFQTDDRIKTIEEFPFPKYIIDRKYICQEEYHILPHNCIKTYDDPYPIYIQILTKEERIIKEIIE